MAAFAGWSDYSLCDTEWSGRAGGSGNLNFVLPTEGWSHVRRVAGTLKIIVILRDPSERPWSHVRFHAIFTGDLARIPEMDADAFETFITTHDLHKHGSYAEVVARLQQEFKENEVGVFFEDMIQDPLAFPRSVEVFLEIEPATIPEVMVFPRVNAGPIVERPASFMRAAKEIIGLETFKIRDPGLEPPASWDTMF